MRKVFAVFILLFLFWPVFVLAEDKININTASLEELDKIIGIGPTLGQRIIDARPFSSVDDLLRVKGIGEKTLAKIKEQGFACVNCQLTQNVETLNPKPEKPEEVGSPAGDPTSNALSPKIAYPGGIFINEILPNPEGSDETDEWIELYNSNNFDVDLSGWKMQDIAGTNAIYNISEGIKILASGFLVFKRPDTKIMLNNDEDGLALLTPDNKLVDSAEYSKAQLGQSYNRTSSGWRWSATLTPQSKNDISVPAPTKNSSKSLPKNQKADKNNTVEPGLADISQTYAPDGGKNQNPWFLFFTALIITIVSAVIVLFIKLKVFKKHVRT